MAEDPSKKHNIGWGLLDECLDSHLTEAYIIWHLRVYTRTLLERQEHVEAPEQFGHCCLQPQSATSPGPQASGVWCVGVQSPSSSSSLLHTLLAALPPSTVTPDTVMWDFINMSRVAPGSRTMSKR